MPIHINGTLWPGEEGYLLWRTPHIPRQGLRPCNPFPDFRRSDILACGRPSLVRYYPHTEQVSLDLNTYPGARANSRSPGDGRGNRSPSHWRRAPTYDRCPNYRLPTGQLDPSGHRRWNQQSRNIRLASVRALNVSEFRRPKQLGFPDHHWSTPQMWVDLRIGDRRPLRERPDGVHQPVNRILMADCEHSANLLFSGRNGCTLFLWMKELTF